MSNYSAQQLAARIKDIRDVENLMGRRAFLNSYKRFDEELDTLWCSPGQNPTLNTNDRKYVGYDAVKAAYADAGARQVAKGNEVMRKLYPNEFAGKSDEEMYAAGTATIHTMTTPIVEIAEDRKTAKGMWYSLGEETEIAADGPEASWCWEKFAADFINEDGKWNIWHLTIFTDILTPVGQNWAKVNHAPSGEDYKGYTPKQLPQDTPPVPEPYDTFASTFSY